MYICTMYVGMYVCMYVSVHVCTYAAMYVCTFVCMYVCTLLQFALGACIFVDDLFDCTARISLCSYK